MLPQVVPVKVVGFRRLVVRARRPANLIPPALPTVFVGRTKIGLVSIPMACLSW